MLTQWLICTFIREMLTMIELYIYKRNADNDLNCTFIREMLTMTTVHLWNADNDWSIHL